MFKASILTIVIIFHLGVGRPERRKVD